MRLSDRAADGAAAVRRHPDQLCKATSVELPRATRRRAYIAAAQRKLAAKGMSAARSRTALLLGHKLLEPSPGEQRPRLPATAGVESPDHP
jgi:hypothetical protein